MLLLSLLVFLPYAGGCAGCGSSPSQHPDGGVTGDGGQTGTDGGQTGTDGGSGGTDGGLADGGTSTGRPPANPNAPGNDTRDTDCDGLSDAEEFSTVYGAGRHTDPNNADSDGDGIPDGVELGRTSSPDPKCQGIFKPDADPTTTTDPTLADTDQDGIPDGIEDANHDGKFEQGETDPNNPDTDGDQLSDGCEDHNHNGVVDTGETDPRLRDTDHDGLPDGLEDKNHNCKVDPGETDPTNPDTDGDGIPDGTEDANHNGIVDPGETNPLVPDVDSDGDGITDARETNVTHTDPHNPDTDGDGLKDGIEDKNQDGKVNLGETDPLRVDTDCDGLTDGQEDKNHNGIVDPGETDPTNPDTDGDGLPDGLEEGVTVNPDPTHCPDVALDQDPRTTTDPTNPDTDGDGLMDGAEDRNHNGRVDPAIPAQNIPAETDPNNPNDANPVITGACATQNLVKVLFHVASTGDIQLASLQSYGDVTTVMKGSQQVGVMVYDPTSHVAGVAIAMTPAGADATADENALRTTLQNHGGVATVITQLFTTWDGYAASRGTLDWNLGGDIETAANTLAQALVPGATGLFAGPGGTSGPFSASLEVVRRSANRSVYVLAFTPKTTAEAPLIAADDLANGSPLAQVGDTTGVQCDTFLSKPPQPVDFLYVVDNSCSMAQEQTILGNATTSTISQLQNGSLDWRLGVIYTDYYNTGLWQGFTTNASTFQTETQPGTGGSGTEESLLSTQDWWNAHHADIRAGAQLVVMILSDEDEHSSNYQNQAYYDAFVTFFRTHGISVNGLICRPGYSTVNCGAAGNGPMAPDYEYVITQLNGVLGYIEDLNSIQPTISAMITATGGATSPYQLSKPPISSTLKLAMDDGTGAVITVPRSRTNGFDYDGANQSIQLFGSYRPAKTGLSMALSYRYWEDRTPNPDGGGCGTCPSPLVCNPQTDTCDCPADCGGNQPGPNYTCDQSSCSWACPSDCNGACTGYQTCDTTSCGCVCAGGVTCAPGYTYDNTACACVCDTGALDCGGNFKIDPNACACVCAPNCNGNCTGNSTCDTSTCTCSSGIIP